MDYRIRRNTQELDSTGYVEIGPGKYSDQHWQGGFLFVWEDAFCLAEGIVTKHFPAYDHLSMNNIPKSLGRGIAAEWREVALRLEGMTAAETRSALNLPEWYGPSMTSFPQVNPRSRQCCENSPTELMISVIERIGFVSSACDPNRPLEQTAEKREKFLSRKGVLCEKLGF